MSKIKQSEKSIKLSPIIFVLVLGLGIVLLSLILSLFQIEGPKATIIALQDSNLPYGVETTVSTVKNAFSKDGIVFMLKNISTGTAMFKPLIMLIIVMIGISVGEVSGLFYSWFNRFKKIRISVLTFAVFFLGVISSYFGIEIYLILLPLAGIFYKYTEKNPMLGIYTIFLGISMGLGTSLLFDYSDHILGLTTQIAANIERNNNYVYSLYSTAFIKFASSLLFSFLGTVIILKFLYPKIQKARMEIMEPDKKGLLLTTIMFAVLSVIVIYQIIPGLPFSGNLLDESQSRYLLQLMSTDSLFKQSYIYIFTIMMMICGAVYGFANKTFSNNIDYSKSLFESIKKTWQLFVLMFFAIQVMSLFEWTNIGEVLATKLIDLLAVLQFSGLLLILAFIIVIILIALVMPVAEQKWKFISPIAVPLFMRSNMTPGFTQFIYSVSDGIGKTMSLVSINIYILVGMLQKYTDDDITVFGTLKTIFTTVVLLTGIWIVIILSWYIIGLPLGINTFATI